METLSEKLNNLFKRVKMNRSSDQLYKESDRLKTFKTWNCSFVDKNLLARTGFFFTGEKDVVKCYFCLLKLGEWERDDDPILEHL